MAGTGMGMVGYAGYGSSDNLRVNGLENELNRVRSKCNTLEYNNEKIKRSEVRAREAESIIR